jgi:hypothetical protein
MNLSRPLAWPLVVKLAAVAIIVGGATAGIVSASHIDPAASAAGAERTLRHLLVPERYVLGLA